MWRQVRDASDRFTQSLDTMICADIDTVSFQPTKEWIGVFQLTCVFLVIFHPTIRGVGVVVVWIQVLTNHSLRGKHD